MNNSLDQLTVLVITLDEAVNIGRTLESVKFAGRILVIDSCSADATPDIVRNFPRATLIRREFTSFAEQCNFGLERIETEWVLSIDADFRFPLGAGEAIAAAMRCGHDFHEAAFDYCIGGEPVRGGILPRRVVLFRRGSAHYVNDGHGHRLDISQQAMQLSFRISHDDRKPLRVWLNNQIRYAAQEADKIAAARYAELSLQDLVRKFVVIAPAVVFLLVYVLRGGFLSGWRGLFYAMQRLAAELLLSLHLLERMITRNSR